MSETRALTFYLWGKRKFMTIRGVFGRARHRYPGCAITFEEDALVLFLSDGGRLRFRREFDTLGNSVIAENPEETP